MSCYSSTRDFNRIRKKLIRRILRGKNLLLKQDWRTTSETDGVEWHILRRFLWLFLLRLEGQLKFYFTEFSIFKDKCVLHSAAHNISYDSWSLCVVLDYGSFLTQNTFKDVLTMWVYLDYVITLGSVVKKVSVECCTWKLWIKSSSY